MNKKTVNKVNGGIAIYYGISCVLGAISGTVGIGMWSFKVLTNQTNFSWGILVGLIIVTGVLGAIGYSILRVSYEDVEK